MELDPRSDDQIFDGPGQERLTGFGERAHASSDVDRHAAHVLADQLDFAGVQPGSDLDTAGTDTIPDGPGTTNGPPGPVEGSQKATPSEGM